MLVFSGGLECSPLNMHNGGSTPSRIEIILAEDNPADISSTLNTLKKANIGNHVRVIRDGKELLDFLFQTGASAGVRPPGSETLILLSLGLSDAHGLDVLRKVKNDERTRTVPVIILTSSQEERGVMQSYKLGANAAIVKPLDLGKLSEVVSELRLGWLLVSAEEKQSRSDRFV